MSWHHSAAQCERSRRTSRSRAPGQAQARAAFSAELLERFSSTSFSCRRLHPASSIFHAVLTFHTPEISTLSSSCIHVTNFYQLQHSNSRILTSALVSKSRSLPNFSLPRNFTLLSDRNVSKGNPSGTRYS